MMQASDEPSSSPSAGAPSSSNHHDAASLVPTEWTYLAEGKLHLLLAYTDSRPRFKDHVLRLLKERHAGEEKAHYHPAHERQYVDWVVGPVLGHQYVDGGVSLSVPRAFLAAVAQQIAPLRPVRRAVYGIDHRATTVECLRDLTRFFPVPRSPASGGPRLTVELKPKAGYCSRSRLVDPAHRIKYSLSRYQLMQQYRHELRRTDGLEPEWGDLVQGPNLDYSPSDLFSGDCATMKTALQALVRNPQNFCQIFVNSKPVYGRGQTDREEAEDATQPLLCGGYRREVPREYQVLDDLMDAVAMILCQEPLLVRLGALQKMDVLDVEGAALVMRRLVALCDGKEDEALALLEVAELSALPHHESMTEGRKTVCVSSALVQRLEALLVVGKEGDLDAQHEAAKAAVGAFSTEECVVLLQRWLVSLGACDCSLMLSLRREPGRREARAQTTTSPGQLFYSNCSEGGGGMLSYFLQVVDLGPKPPTKILSKADMEAKIVALATRYGERNVPQK